MTGRTDTDIPETGAIFTFGRSSFADNLPSRFWLKNDSPARVSCGREHSAVITGNGKLLVFGCNSSGQLGLNLKPDVKKPASLKAFRSEKVRFVACGRDHTIVCTSEDRVYYTGRNQKAQLGQRRSPKTGSFLQLHPFCQRARVTMLSAGCSTSAALTDDGRLFMWGDNSAGQIGLGDELFTAEPREVGVGEAVKWVSCGNRHSAFVTVAGDLYTFGESANGRLGLQVEQLENHRVPQRVQGVPGHVTQVCCGGQHTVVLTGEDVFTFGGGRYGQLGHGTFLFEAPWPKPLQHFHKCSVRQIACGENHTAVITNGGLLYTFGDGRHGKLGLTEENFVNQFSPTLCTQFLKFHVQSVSCGDHHMLVLAVPRPARAQEGLEKDFKSMENFLLSSCAEIPLKEQLISLSPVFPLSALAARARHREKKLSQEMLGETFLKLPRLDSDFLNSSWKISRNIQTLKDMVKPPSSSTLKSGESPLLSPRSQSVSPLSPALSSKPSSSRSVSSSRSKASASDCLTSKPAKLPSSLLSPKSIKCTPKKAVLSEKRAQTRAKKAAGSQKALSDKLFSPLPPKEPSRPTRQAFDENISEKEDSASMKAEGEALHRRATQDVQKRGGDFSPNTVDQKDRSHGRVSKGKQAFYFDEKRDPYSRKASTTDPLSSSMKKEATKTRTRKHRFLSTQENIHKKTIKTKKRLSSLGTANHGKRSELLWYPEVQKAVTEGKEDVDANKEEVNEKISSSTLKLPRRNDVNTHALTDQTSWNNTVESGVKMQQETGVDLTPTKQKCRVKAAPAKSRSSKLEPEKQPSCGKQRAEVHTKEVMPGKHEGQRREPKAKPDSKSSTKSVKKAAREIKVQSANKQMLPKAKEDEESEAKARLGTKPGELKVVSPGLEDKKKKKTKASHHDGFSSQSPKRTEVLSVSGDKSPQSPHPAGAESLPADVDRKEAQILKEQKSGWEEHFQDAASLLPAMGMAGAAAGFLSEAMTNVVSFHSDSDKDSPSLPKTPLGAKRFTRQQEVQSISSSATHVSSNKMEESMTEDAPVSSLIGDAQGKEDEDAPESLRSEDEDGKTADEKEKNSGTDADKKRRQTENREGGDTRSSTEAEEEGNLNVGKEEEDWKEKSSSNADEEDAGSDASEREEEESSRENKKTHSEVSEGAEEEEESEAEELSDEGQEEEEVEEEVGGDVSEDEKESSASKSEEEEEGDTGGSTESEEESDLSEEEEESEEQKGDDSSDSQMHEMESAEESAREEDDEEEICSAEEEAEQTSDMENEEEASIDDEATDDEEEDEEYTGEEEEEEEESTIDKEEETDEGREEEEPTGTEEEEEEEMDSLEEDGKIKQTESEEETDEEHDKEGKSDKEGMESEEEEGEEEEDESVEEEEEEDEEEEEEVEDDEEGEEVGKEEGGEEEEVENEEEEEEENEEEEGEEVGNEDEEEEEGEEVGNDDEEEEVNEEGEEEGEEVGNEEEEVNEEEEEGEDEEEEGEEVGNEEEEGRQENEEEEGVELEEEEKEEDEVAKTGKDEAQKPSSLDRKAKREEAPTPAPRTKQTSVKKKQEDPQQFWNDVLPQYLDIQ